MPLSAPDAPRHPRGGRCRPRRAGRRRQHRYRASYRGMPPNSYERSALFLDRKWDPIGVYDSVTTGRRASTSAMPAHVLGRLRRGETAEGNSRYLHEQATRSMGVEPGPTRAVAGRLHHWPDFRSW
jgi:hypothetical protein